MIVRKESLAPVRKADGDLEFVLSDATKDRYGDVIDPKGWVLTNFKKNPIALFNHDSHFPIGHWTNVRVDGGKLVGKLKLAAEGTSQRLDEIIRLVAQGVLRAVSVGFSVIEQEALADNSGIRFIRQELLETSLVSVPANPSAVQLARSLHVSDDTIDFVFGKHASADGVYRRDGSPAEYGTPSPIRKSTSMSTLATRIQAAEQRKSAADDELKVLLEQPEFDSAENDRLTAEVEKVNSELDGLRRAEKALGTTAQPIVAQPVTIQGVAREVSVGPVVKADLGRPFAMPAKKVEPREHVWRSLVATVHAREVGENPDAIRRQRYGDDPLTKAVFDGMVTKAASVPATTTTSGWASQLIETVTADYLQDLMPASVYPALSARGLRLNFGRAGVITIPARLSTPTLAGSFVAEGAAIPVRQGAFTSIALTPKKMAVITTLTREVAQHSNPTAEAILRDAMQEDTSVAIDTVLLDATVASAIRPAGLRNGVTGLTATAGGGFNALVGDVKALLGALITGTNGNVRQPVWIMNPAQAIAASMTANAGGDFPFEGEVNGGRFRGYPLIQSPTVPAGVVILIDAADFVSVTGDEPQFSVSDQATLHMEDTAPTQINPGTVASPLRSMFQTDSLAIRMVLPMNWAVRRTGVTAFTSAVTW